MCTPIGKRKSRAGKSDRSISLLKLKWNQMSDIYSVLCCCVCVNRRSSVTQMVKSLGQVNQANVFLFSFLIPNCKCGWWTASVAIWFSILRDSGWGKGIISKIARGKRQADVNKIKDFSWSKFCEEMHYNHTPQVEVKEAGNFVLIKRTKRWRRSHHPEKSNRTWRLDSPCQEYNNKKQHIRRTKRRFSGKERKQLTT